MKEFLKQWADILLMVPISFLLLIGAYFGIHSIDQTAILLDLGTLQILFLNVLTYLTVNFLAYFTYKINFTDGFQKGWGIGTNPIHKLIANLLLWFVQLAIAAWMITRNL